MASVWCHRLVNLEHILFMCRFVFVSWEGGEVCIKKLRKNKYQHSYCWVGRILITWNVVLSLFSDIKYWAFNNKKATLFQGEEKNPEISVSVDFADIFSHDICLKMKQNIVQVIKVLLFEVVLSSQTGNKVKRLNQIS